MYVYVCICMYYSGIGFNMSKYEKQYMQVYVCICMNMHVSMYEYACTDILTRPKARGQMNSKNTICVSLKCLSFLGC